MKNKIFKFLTIFLILAFILLISGNTFAAVKDFPGASGDGLEGVDTVTSIIGIVLTVVRTVGMGVAIIILIVIGCKYMIASSGERAEIKKYAIHYVIGAIVLFAASGLITIIRDAVAVTIS